ncbi:hypothetical protein OUZ56_005768 [Daphnia magna]|uniref:Uncharacterized protein n=1 Tax=Daphnia magna TaxID=35525 RepID=A0ABQ9YTQ3_9CRUS|nr:hypothetical protein OUZ56_005768 [Daphnia magna]
MIPNAESVDLEAIEQPEIGKVAGSTKTEFISELWNQGYKLADDRILSGTPAPCQIDILIRDNQVWKDETVAISSTTAIGFLLKAKEGTPQYLTQDSNSNRND